MRGVHRGLLRLGSGHGGEQAADEFLDLGVVAGGEVGEHEMLEGEPDLGEAGSDGDEHHEPEMVDGAVDADEQQRCELHEDAGGEKADAFAERYGFWAGAGEALGGDYAFLVHRGQCASAGGDDLFGVLVHDAYCVQCCAFRVHGRADTADAVPLSVISAAGCVGGGAALGFLLG